MGWLMLITIRNTTWFIGFQIPKTSGSCCTVTALGITITIVLCNFNSLLHLQYLTKKLGADATIYGQIQTVFAVAQLVGGVLYGRLGDLFSDRTALLVAFASASPPVNG